MIIPYLRHTGQPARSQRFAIYTHPSSFEPHIYLQGVLKVEVMVPEETMARLESLGHEVQPWPEWQRESAVTAQTPADSETGVLAGGADPRRENYAASQ